MLQSTNRVGSCKAGGYSLPSSRKQLPRHCMEHAHVIIIGNCITRGGRVPLTFAPQALSCWALVRAWKFGRRCPLCELHP